MKNVKCVVVTGTPGCGKTRIAKALARELGWMYIDGRRIARALSSKYDKKRRCSIVDEGAFARKVHTCIKELDGRAVVDSHLSHFIDPALCRACIVVTCPLDILAKRLRQRGYSVKKTAENLQCEIMEVCKSEALAYGHRVIQISGVGTLNLVALKKKLRIGNTYRRQNAKKKRRKGLF